MFESIINEIVTNQNNEQASLEIAFRCREAALSTGCSVTASVWKTLQAKAWSYDHRFASDFWTVDFATVGTNLPRAFESYFRYSGTLDLLSDDERLEVYNDFAHRWEQVHGPA